MNKQITFIRANAKEIQFDSDICSICFGQIKSNHNQEPKGYEKQDPGFVSPNNGNFKLSRHSIAKNNGKCVTLRAGIDWAGDYNCSLNREKPVDIGAFQGKRIITGPPFVAKFTEYCE